MTDSLATGAVDEGSLAGDAAAAAAAAAQPGAAAAGAAKEPPAADPGASQAAPAAGKWPDNWREILAGEDKKELEGLGRFASPSDVWKAQKEAARKISEGLKPIQKPGDKATDEDWKKFRESAGIPEKVEDFVKAIQLPDKRQIGAEDLPVVSAFAERAIKKGVTPADMAVMVDSYYALQEEQAVQMAETDAKYRRESEQALRDEYGGDLKVNVAAMRPYFEAFDPKLFDNLMGGRLADGTKIGNNPSLIKFFVAKALDENPAATIVPGGNTSAETIDTEIKALEKRMGEDRTAWFKDEPAQKRLAQLYEAQRKLAK